MLSYKNELRVAVLMEHGVVDCSMLSDDPRQQTSVDQPIINLARRVLNKAEKTAFFLAYHCSPSWEEIQYIFKEQFARTLRLETVQAYGDRATAKIIAAAAECTELKKLLAKKPIPSRL
jgi:hypothetical protein